jgi:hypothetical protein
MIMMLYKLQRCQEKTLHSVKTKDVASSAGTAVRHHPSNGEAGSRSRAEKEVI